MLRLVKRKDRRGYSIDGRIAGQRLRASLMTGNRQAALLALSKIERALPKGRTQGFGLSCMIPCPNQLSRKSLRLSATLATLPLGLT